MGVAYEDGRTGGRAQEIPTQLVHLKHTSQDGASIPHGWLRSTAVEHQSLAGELSLSCTRPVADG